ncbi:MAG: NAD(P)-binding protein, partial [Anaerolineae bacterium]|nr:NAD(P)-binding protein [Anaerolineae bacterium]
MTPQSWLTQPAGSISLPSIEQSAPVKALVVATHLTELEERILKKWDQARTHRMVEVLPDDFEQVPLDRQGLHVTLRCCPELITIPHETSVELSCPLCDALQREMRVIDDVQLPSGRNWEIWVNKRSYEPYQILIMPLDRQGNLEHRSRNQEATREDLEDMLALKQRLPNFRIFFNALGAGNSQQHQHFQGYFAGEDAFVQVEKQAAQGLWKQGNFWLAQVEDWPTECIRMRGQHSTLSAWAAQAIQLARKQGFAYNLFFTANALYFARRKQLGSEHLCKVSAGALDVFDLKHIVPRPVFDLAKSQSLNVPCELESLYADIACCPTETTTFVQELVTQFSGDCKQSPLALAGSTQAQEATILEILAACASEAQDVRTAARVRLETFIKDELSRRKAEVEAATGGNTASGNMPNQLAHKWTRFTRWAEPRLRPAEERIKDTEEVNQGLRIVDALIEASRCLLCKEPVCVKGCPVVIDIKGFIQALTNGDVKQAYAIIHEANTLAPVTSRVCPQETQCQATCTLSKRGDAISIGLLERAVVELSDLFCASNIIEDGICSVYTDIVAPEKDYPIAIIGTGPAGLTAAAELARRYTRVVIFEALPEPGGGVLKYGIPDFRLPKHIVQEGLDTVRSRGVTVIFDVAIGRTLTIADLRKMGFRAIMLGTGAGLPKFMGIPGEELNGVITANEFLMRYNLMSAGQPGYDTPIKVGRKV